MAGMKFGASSNNEPQQNAPEKVADEQVSDVIENKAGETLPSDLGVSKDGSLDIADTVTNISGQDELVNGAGMSSEELKDANKIKVTIADYKTPLVVFFGPPACGKTMTLIRLTRYLQSRGYAIEPVTSFRPTYDTNYSNMCRNFDAMIGSDDAAKSTDKINFMLVQVLRDGKPLCQILEGPGEYYFNPEDPMAKFPRYVNAIINSQNRKIWAIMVEPDQTSMRMSAEARRNYVTKIHKLKTRISSRDKALFVFNKIDETPFVNGVGNVKYNLAMQQVEFLYPGIFAPFMNENPITKWWKPYNFDFVAFQTGDFSKAGDGTLTFEQGSDVYPQRLWSIILKLIRG